MTDNEYGFTPDPSEERVSPPQQTPDEVYSAEMAAAGGISTEPTHPPRSDPWCEPVYSRAEDGVRPYSPTYRAGGYSQYAASELEKKKKPKRAGRFFKTLCLVLVCVVFCSLASATAAYFVVDYRLSQVDFNTTTQVVIGNQTGTQTGSSGSNAAVTPPEVTGNAMSGGAIYDLACTQVVGVTTSVTSQNFFGQTTESPVTGSGFIISEDGYILTNYHVVEYAAQYGYALSVFLHDGQSYPAAIIGYDAGGDTAVIKIDAAGLNPVTFGSSDALRVGDTVYAVGNPLGELNFSMTSGIVSARNREISFDDGTTLNMFQFDAAVNSGNSGGPLYNAAGEVVGIVTAKYSSSGVEGLGFAIPIDSILTDISDLIVNGYITGRPTFSITGFTMPESAAYYYNTVQGVYVHSVIAGGCSDRAGLRVGDIIVALDGVSVLTMEELNALKFTHSAGDTVTVTVYRAQEYVDIPVTLDESVGDQSAQQAPQGGYPAG